MANFKENLVRVKAFIFDIDGVLSLQTINLNSFGFPNRTVNLRDGYALQLAVKKGYNVAVISGAISKSLAHRMHALNVKDLFMGVENKIDCFHEYLTSKNVKPEHVLYMGDDIPDYEVMLESAVSSCPADAAEEIKKILGAKPSSIANINGFWLPRKNKRFPKLITAK